MNVNYFIHKIFLIIINCVVGIEFKSYKIYETWYKW